VIFSLRNFKSLVFIMKKINVLCEAKTEDINSYLMHKIVNIVSTRCSECEVLSAVTFTTVLREPGIRTCKQKSKFFGFPFSSECMKAAHVYSRGVWTY
jgi:hypothetical protein